jgi:hypothetical protein
MALRPTISNNLKTVTQDEFFSLTPIKANYNAFAFQVIRRFIGHTDIVKPQPVVITPVASVGPIRSCS